jgi:hypothetical protein
MLIALMTVMLFGGGGATYDLFAKDAQQAVLSVLDDAALQKQVKSLMKQGVKAGKKASKELASLFKSWQKADLDPATGRAEFDQMLVEAGVVRSKAQESFLDIVFEIRDQVTAEQWEAAFGDFLGGERKP